jgi:hypothetical protein
MFVAPDPGPWASLGLELVSAVKRAPGPGLDASVGLFLGIGLRSSRSPPVGQPTTPFASLTSLLGALATCFLVSKG